MYPHVPENEGGDQRPVQRAQLAQKAGIDPAFIDKCEVHPAHRHLCSVHGTHPHKSDDHLVNRIRASRPAPSQPSILQQVHFADDTKIGNVLSKSRPDEPRLKSSYASYIGHAMRAGLLPLETKIGNVLSKSRPDKPHLKSSYDPYTRHVRHVGLLPLGHFDDQRHPSTWPNMKRNAFATLTRSPPKSGKTDRLNQPLPSLPPSPTTPRNPPATGGVSSGATTPTAQKGPVSPS
ncbi:uncharacterized protein N7515_000635 [Penicillium bovifimosum]|uniref:Uncharacterized protein n=1 Tax=Penicillium bovifimosum TaxID=126998 RepID=A0A9W9HFY3_9EURO|nr:uncharacterized protein N7515_000635 [Penicillium bovifimosum]KAJ5146071.1 hypothetical protein N7515_000635 [Penicillium bovifimosum]